ncbi:transglycosylase SLT domain-containing protein [bacterium]|nr:transglycosylase SLT domain-containing protein [bacterium]
MVSKRANPAARASAVTTVFLALALVSVSPALADGLRIGAGAKSRAAMFRSQVALLDGRLSQQYANSVRLKPGAGKDPSAENVRYSGSYRGEYLAMAKAAARKYGVPEEMFLKLVQRESGWNPGAVSAKGAVGLAQLMPETANHLGVDETDPKDNLEGGARYLAMMFTRFGSWKLALAAYNAGPQAVEAAGGIPDFEETQSYVAAILG